MKKLGEFLLAKEVNAIAVAFFCALLAAFHFPVGFIAVIIVGLVTLQKGSKSGLFLLAWVALPAIALMVLRKIGAFDILLLRCVIIWLLASFFNRYRAWNFLLLIVASVGVIAIFGLHFWIPELTQWWSNELTVFFQKMLTESHWKIGITPTEFANNLAPIATGMAAFFFLGVVLLELCVARYWQCAINNTREFSQEFTRIRIGRVAMMVASVLVALIFLKIPAAKDAFPLVLLPFFVAGLSVLHFWVQQKKQWVSVMFFVYLGIIFLPAIVVSALALLAAVDTWYNFRKKMVELS